MIIYIYIYTYIGYHPFMEAPHSDEPHECPNPASSKHSCVACVACVGGRRRPRQQSPGWQLAVGLCGLRPCGRQGCGQVHAGGRPEGRRKLGGFLASKYIEITQRVPKTGYFTRQKYAHLRENPHL